MGYRVWSLLFAAAVALGGMSAVRGARPKTRQPSGERERRQRPAARLTAEP